MAKTQPLDSTDLIPAKSLSAPKVSRPIRPAQQGDAVSSGELVPMQFRMPPDFVKAYKQAALDRGMKLNELLKLIFDDFSKKAKA